MGIRNASGTLVAQYVYDAWGNHRQITDGSGNDVSDNPNHIANINPFRYRGCYYDTETGWYYLNARYYDPNVGRFLSPDTILGANGGLLGYNLYAYCNNNPVMFVDPSGNFALSLGSALYGLALAVTALVAVNETVESLPPLPANPQELLPLIGVIDIEDHLEDLQDILKKKLIKDIVTKTRDAVAASKDVVVEKDIAKPLPPDTVIYRYGGTNPGNLTPKFKDRGNGLSFSLTPPISGEAAVTTIGAINSTGVVWAVRDGVNHVSVRPIGATTLDWIGAGSNSVWTKAVKSVVVRYK